VWPQVSGIVLAGGRAARFGSDKLAHRIAGATLLDRSIDAVREVADEVIVAGRSGTASSAFVREVDDAEPFGGPLLGLLGALEAARGAHAIVVGGDMPGLVPAVLRALLDRLSADRSIGAVILGPTDRTTARGRHPVLPIALEVEAARTAARATVEAGGRSLQGLLDHLAWVALPASSWLPLDPEARTLLDVDTPADLERARGGS
jgi:molybdenum cofactor guanylyltransferase